ncbi:MAG: nitrogen fixation protein NifZ [Rhodobacteraceae bacterium]|nr:nitrogen fixation protein NifZ [Paracoccaceae bacterium]MAY44691.1 nitrogen fixation protein NifZ [Paracoccaceae bacterium]QEW20028.1 NifZ domain protein [Marinibacterium anthonyi]
MSTDDREIEVYRDPAFMPGDKVISKKNIKNDGTMAGKEIGETVVKKGDVGYVRDIGVFLQQFYIYAVDFVDRASIVGMRERELIPDSEPARTAGGDRVVQSHIITRDTSQEARP